MGNSASTLVNDIQTRNDLRYYAKNQVYNRVESDDRFATKDSIPSLDNVYSKPDIDSLLKNSYYDQATSDSRFAVKQVEGDLQQLKGTVASMQSNTALKSDLPTLDNVYTKDAANSTFATKDTEAALATLRNSVYTKEDTDSIFKKYYDSVAADAKFAKVGDSYLKTESDAQFAKVGDSYLKTEADTRFAKVGDSYIKTEADSRFALKSSENEIAMLKSNIYTKEDIDKFIADFRNSLGLPPTSPFPEETTIQWALDQMAKLTDVTNRFRDVKVTPNIESADTCSGLCKDEPNARIAVYRGSTKECFCKSSVTFPTSDPGTVSYIPNKVPQRGTWHPTSKLPERLSYQGNTMAQNEFCLTADGASGNVTWNSCMSSPSQVIKYSPGTGFLQTADGKCIVMKPDQSGTIVGNCPTESPLPSAHPARWTWNNSGQLQTTMNPLTAGGERTCLGTADQSRIVSGSQVTTSPCNSGNLSWVPQNDYVAFNGIADTSGIGYNTSQVNDHRECRMKCSADGNCDMYMHNPSTKECILSQLAQVASMTSGIKMLDNSILYREGRNSLGDSLTGLTSTASSAVDCGSQCIQNNNCFTMTYDSSKTTNNCVQYGASTTRIGNIAFKPLGENRY